MTNVHKNWMFIHDKPKGFKSGLKICQHWLWEPADWINCSVCGMYHSNRDIPEEFWNREWSKDDKKVQKAGIIFVRGDEVLVTQSYHNLFGFPKGNSNLGESPSQCAKREFKEETGIDINVNLSECEKIVYKNKYTFFVVRVSNNFEISTTPLDSAEITTFGWYSVHRIKDLNFSKAMNAVFEQYKKIH